MDIECPKTIQGLIEWHRNRARRVNKVPEFENGLNTALVDWHNEAADLIEKVLAGHRGIVDSLLRQMGNRHAREEALLNTMHELSIEHFNMNRDSLSLVDELNAEKSCNHALNERLAEFEAREAQRAQSVPDATANQPRVPGQPEPSPEVASPETLFLHAARLEIDRARQKHPSTEAMGIALAEETGEVAQALVDESPEDVYAECVQVASTAMRIALEGDRAADYIRARKGLLPLPGSPFAGPDWNGDGEVIGMIKTPHDLRAAIASEMMTLFTSNKTVRSDAALDAAARILNMVAAKSFDNSRQGDLPGV